MRPLTLETCLILFLENPCCVPVGPVQVFVIAPVISCFMQVILMFLIGLPDQLTNKGYVVNMQHQMMENGDTIVGTLWYQEMVIVPNPANNQQFYLFSSE